MNDMVTIEGERFSQLIVDLINGEKGKKEIDTNLLPIAMAFQNPKDLPFLFEDIFDLRDYEYADDIRFAAIRVQIYCDINMNRDMEKFTLLQYVAKTIEAALFTDLLIEGVDFEELEIDRRKKYGKPKKKGKGKAKK